MYIQVRKSEIVSALYSYSKEHYETIEYYTGRQALSLSHFLYLSLSIYIYIYVCMYVCVCVCFFKNNRRLCCIGYKQSLFCQEHFSRSPTRHEGEEDIVKVYERISLAVTPPPNLSLIRFNVLSQLTFKLICTQLHYFPILLFLIYSKIISLV